MNVVGFLVSVHDYDTFFMDVHEFCGFVNFKCEVAKHAVITKKNSNVVHKVED